MQPCRLRDLAYPRGRLSFGPKAGQVADCIRGTLAKRVLKNIHATLRAAGFGVPLGAIVVWPQGRASCGMHPRYPWPKGSKKHSCNPVGCGIWRALGGDFRLALRPGKLRAAPAAPLAQRGLKNIHATLRAAEFGVPLGATFVWPQGREGCGLLPRHLGRKGSKKTFMQPCGLRDLARPRGRWSLGLKTGQVADCICGTLGQKRSKKHSCNLVGCGIWRALGGDFRLASRPSRLRAAPAAPWPKGV